jgi:hypothetical protein
MLRQAKHERKMLNHFNFLTVRPELRRRTPKEFFRILLIVQMHKRSHPVFWLRRMALAGDIFGEKDVSRAESHR